MLRKLREAGLHHSLVNLSFFRLCLPAFPARFLCLLSICKFLLSSFFLSQLFAVTAVSLSPVSGSGETLVECGYVGLRVGGGWVGKLVGLNAHIFMFPDIYHR